MTTLNDTQLAALERAGWDETGLTSNPAPETLDCLREDLAGAVEAGLKEEAEALRAAIALIEGRRNLDASAYDLAPGVTLQRQPLPQAVPEGYVGLVLQIENTYELHDDVTTYASVSVPLPPSSEGEDDASVQARTDWSWDNIDPLTGVGHTDGDSWYDVTVLESSDPTVIPVDTTWEFGY